MKKITLYSVILMIVLIVFTFCIKKIIFTKNGYVTVKGAAEKTVIADMAYWTISFVNAGNDLSVVKDKNSADLQVVIDFLKENNFKPNEYKINSIELIDMDTREYKDPNQQNRYILTQSVSVITNNVDLVSNVSQNLDQLIDKNVSIKCSYGEMKPVYKFTKLNLIKQEMLKEATINAKNTAKQFAIDSNTRVGKIKYANQGIFNITSKDKSANYDNELFAKEKEVRVVITIDYWLK